MPDPSAPSDNTTLIEVLDAFKAAGFTHDFLVTKTGDLVCRECGETWRPGEIGLEDIRRLEGASDPADMAAVLALVCPGCGARGTAIVRFGPEAEAYEADLLLALEDLRPR